MQDVVIVGAGGFGRELLMVIKEINKIECKWNVIGFIDNRLDALDGIECDKKIISTVDDWMPPKDVYHAIAIARIYNKKKVINEIKSRNGKFATIIHPSARIADYSTIGEGVIMFHYVDISVNCRIEDFVFVNTFSQVGHDSVIGKYSTLFPNSSVSGGCIIGEGVTIGTSASIHPGIVVGDNATIGMNSAVLRNVKPNTTVMGVPAKKIL